MKLVVLRRILPRVPAESSLGQAAADQKKIENYSDDCSPHLIVFLVDYYSICWVHWQQRCWGPIDNSFCVYPVYRSTREILNTIYPLITLQLNFLTMKLYLIIILV